MKISNLIAELLLISIPFWGFGKDPNNYYPLKEGRRWVYLFSMESMLKRKTNLKLTMTNLKPLELDGIEVIPQHVSIGGKSYTGFIAQDKNGVYEFANQLSRDKEIKINQVPIYFLIYPIKLGKEWESKTKTSLLMGETPIKLKCIIESKNDMARVIAGNFTRCLRIKCMGSAKKDFDTLSHLVNINVENYEWYAPGVGLVKSVIKEEIDSPIKRSVKANIELVDFNQ